MTTDLVEKEQTGLAPVIVKSAAVQDFELAQRVASAYSTATMVPELYQGNLGNCLIAFNLANRWKADIFMVMQNVYVIHGRPGVEGKLVIGLINNCGLFERLEFEETEDSCMAFAKELKTGKILKGALIDWTLVQAEGWNKDKKNKKTGYVQRSKWNTMKQQMFRYRSAVFFARAFCPEVVLGMQTREELEDITDTAQGADGTYESVKEKTRARLAEFKEKINADLEKKVEKNTLKEMTGEDLDPDTHPDNINREHAPLPERSDIDPMAGAADELDRRLGGNQEKKVPCRFGCGTMVKEGATRHENSCEKNPDNVVPETDSPELANLKSNFPNIDPDLFGTHVFQNLQNLLISEKAAKVWAAKWGRKEIVDEETLNKATTSTMKEASRETLENHEGHETGVTGGKR